MKKQRTKKDVLDLLVECRSEKRQENGYFADEVESIIIELIDARRALAGTSRKAQSLHDRMSKSEALRREAATKYKERIRQLSDENTGYRRQLGLYVERDRPKTGDPLADGAKSGKGDHAHH